MNLRTQKKLSKRALEKVNLGVSPTDEEQRAFVSTSIRGVSHLMKRYNKLFKN